MLSEAKHPYARREAEGRDTSLRSV